MPNVWFPAIRFFLSRTSWRKQRPIIRVSLMTPVSGACVRGSVLCTVRPLSSVRAGVDWVKYSVQAGERIVTQGQPVTQEVRDKLAGLQRELRRRGEDTIMT